MQSKEQQQFRVFGMDCAEEVAILRRELGPIAGSPENLAFDILNGKMIVRVDAARLPPRKIAEAVARTGMRAEEWREVQPGAAEAGFWQRRGRTIMTAVSGISCAAGFGVHVWLAGGVLAAIGSEGMGVAEPVPAAVRALYLLAIVTGAWYILPKALYSLRRARPDMNLLMTIAVVGAIFIGEWFEAATVSFLFALSLALEAWSVGRARRAVEALIAIAPPTARVLVGGREQEVAAADVLVGSRFLVKPGDRIPLDGIVVRGTSEVDQAPITGESVPVLKEVGAQVFAGTINGTGSLEVESTRLAGETTLAQIIRMVGEAQSKRAPSEQWVDRFAQVYTPAILGAAIVIALLPPVFLGGWADWFYRSLVLLVIGCPCALVISTPVSVVASLAAAARNGVLIKGGVHVETPARLRAIALDKTGTLTRGEPHVVEVVALNHHTEEELISRAAAMEAHSDHPLARAIVAYAASRSISASPADDFKAVHGKGAVARFDGTEYWLGSHRYLEERGQETADIHHHLESMSTAGSTVVVIGTADHVCGFIALADTVRPEAAAAIQALRRSGVEHVIMLTGDNRGTADAIARQTGVDEVRAELLPADKVLAVEDLVRRYQAVGMIGDGVNDAPAMGRATLGIAMGAAGTDAAVEAGDVALMSDDLSKLPWLIHHSRRTLVIIRQNVAVSLGVKALFVVLTFAGHASLWAAIAADMGVSLLVIANALRLLR
jgi:Zn2+/Cd2+-exporting ATPase